MEFLNFLKEKGIPLIILSSSGLGKESIESFLKNKGVLSDNIYIISNSFEWDKNGKAIKVKEPIIHIANKNEHTAKNFPEIFEKIKNRKNVILLGDSISDTEMVSGFNYDSLIKIGFFNENVEDNVESYKNNFDVVITHDFSMQFVLDFTKKLKK
jgi:cytosolic 5'-nucleotidase 3